MSTPTTNTSMASSTAAGAKSSSNDADESSTSMMHDKIISLFSKIDPFLRFLTKATGKTSVPLKLLQQVLPKSNNDVSNTVSSSEDGSNGLGSSNVPNQDSKQTNNANTENDAKCNDNCNMNEMLLLELNYRGVLNYDSKKQTVGFPLPPSPSNSNDSSAGASAHHSTMTLPKPPSKMVGKGLHGSCK